MSWFATVRSGKDVKVKWPDPEVYLKVLADLEYQAGDCLAFEDFANGLRAARATGLPAIVAPGLYTASDDFSGGLLIVGNLADPFSSAQFQPPASMRSLPADSSKLVADPVYSDQPDHQRHEQSHQASCGRNA